jgi:hypothetical protein
MGSARSSPSYSTTCLFLIKISWDLAEYNSGTLIECTSLKFLRSFSKTILATCLSSSMPGSSHGLVSLRLWYSNTTGLSLMNRFSLNNQLQRYLFSITVMIESLLCLIRNPVLEVAVIAQIVHALTFHIESHSRQALKFILQSKLIRHFH